MKKTFYINSLIILMIITFFSCEEKESTEHKCDEPQSSLFGTWTSRFAFISKDTIEFGNDSVFYKHFYFNGWKYKTSGDTIAFSKDSLKGFCMYQFIDDDEILIQNYKVKTYDNVSRKVYFIKVKNSCGELVKPIFQADKLKSTDTLFEKYPELIYNSRDTIVFGSDGFIHNHFYFKNWKYQIALDYLKFFNGKDTFKFDYEFNENNEFVIHNFLKGIKGSIKTDVYFTKPKNL